VTGSIARRPAARNQLRAIDVDSTESLRAVLNEILLDLSVRLEEVEKAKGIFVLQPLAFDIGATYSATSGPFSPASGGLRCTVPFVPTGLVLLRIENAGDPATPISNAVSVSWRLVASPDGSTAIQIDFVTGLAINSSYLMTLGVTRG
jgi:hypothetical protein